MVSGMTDIYAQLQADEYDCRNPQTCEAMMYCNELPSYFCECERGVKISSSIDTLISSPMWFRTPFKSFSEGLLVYWFGSDTIMVEAYPFCSFDSASFVKRVNPYGSYYLSAEEIQLLMGSAGSLFEHVDVRFHMQPVGIDSLGQPLDFSDFEGRVVCFAGAEGAHSACDDGILSLNDYGNIAFADTCVVYRFDVKHDFSRPSYLRYRNQKDMSEQVELYLTYGTCMGDTMDTYVFTDSIHPYFFPLDLLKRAYQEQEPIYIHLKKPESRYLANLYYRPYYRLYEQQVDTVICAGKGFVLPDTTLYETTVFRDTICSPTFKTDTLYARLISLNIADGAVVHRTVNVLPTKLPYLYGMTRLYKYGDYEFTSHREGECDVTTVLHLRPVYTVTEEERDTTLCRGLSLAIGGSELWQNGDIRDTLYSGEYLELMHVVTYHATFTEPALEYDTVRVHADMLPYNYQGARVSSISDTTVFTKLLGQCVRHVQLHVVESDKELRIETAERDTVVCSEQGFMLPDTLLQATTTYVDTAFFADTLARITTWNVTALPVESQRFDTISVDEAELLPKVPLYNQKHAISAVGDTVVIDTLGSCYLYTNLSVLPKYVYTDIDTTVCQGLPITIGDTTFFQNTDYLVYDSLNRWTQNVTRWHLKFKKPKAERVSIEVQADQLPYAYGDSLLTASGTYDFLVHAEGECDRLTRVELVVLSAVENLSQSLVSVEPTIIRAGQQVTLRAAVPVRLTVTNAQGQVMQTGLLSAGKHLLTLPTEGLYVLTLTSEGLTSATKVLVR